MKNKYLKPRIGSFKESIRILLVLTSFLLVIFSTNPGKVNALISFPNTIDTLEEKTNIQKVLNAVISPSPQLVVDGVLGRKSIQAVQSFQESKNLVPDGKIGPLTRAALEAAQTNTGFVLNNSGCNLGDKFNPKTGQACDQENISITEAESLLPPGCTPTTAFSPLNGKSCTSKNLVLGVSGGGGGGGGGSRINDNSSGNSTGGGGSTSGSTGGSGSSGGGGGGDTTSSGGDVNKPVVESFTLSEDSSQTVDVISFIATDNVGVTGYMITSTMTAPSVRGSGWLSNPPLTYTFQNSNRTAYAWAKDGSNNLSHPRSFSVLNGGGNNGGGNQGGGSGNIPDSFDRDWQTTSSQGDPDLTKQGRTYYIDPNNNQNNRDGSIDNPYKTWQEVPKDNSNWAYLFKRGTTSTLSSMNFMNKANISIGAYGSGTRPKIISTSGGNAISFDYNNTSIQLSNTKTHIAGLDVSCQSQQCDSVISAHHNSVIEDNYLHNGDSIIRAVGDDGVSGGNPQANALKNVTIKNNVLRDAGSDGMFIRNVYGLLLIEGNLIEKVNQRYFTNPSESYAAGDGIQLSGGTPNWKIIDNKIDRSDTGNKFALIIHNSKRDSNYQYEISGNTFISPKSTGNGGALLYYNDLGSINEYNYNVSNNYFIGDKGSGRQGLSALWWDGTGLTSEDNIYKDVSTGVHNGFYPNPRVLYSQNDTFINCTRNTYGNVEVN